MTTLGLRGYLAVAFLGAAGVTGAYPPLMVSPVPGGLSAPLAADVPAASPGGLLHRLLVSGCELTAGAGGPDSDSARTRRAQCDSNHAGTGQSH